VAPNKGIHQDGSNFTFLEHHAAQWYHEGPDRSKTDCREAVASPPFFPMISQVLESMRSLLVCRQLLVVLSLAASCLNSGRHVIADAGSPPAFELRDGDRVVFLGNTLIEREQFHGHWETMLTAAWPNANITFRNLGWSGDTVWAESRGLFDDPAAGYQRLIEQLKQLKPTVVFLAYGGNEAYAGKAGIERFRAQLEKLLGEIDALQARVVFLAPLRHENLGPPLPDAAEINANLADYTQVLKEVAARRGNLVVDLNEPATSRKEPQNLTYNGLHLTEAGYIATAQRLRKALGVPASKWDQALQHPESGAGQALRTLREAIIEKNFLYFQNWRPQNVTYLFLFRKHEQGNNAGEVAEFEKLVAQQEAKIAELRKAWGAVAL
jgi:lysophospholipase L1-like esterase